MDRAARPIFQCAISSHRPNRKAIHGIDSPGMADCQPMSVTVKICGITNIDDARHALHAGADALGFVFHEQSPRFLELAEAAQLTAQLPAGVSRVGVFVDPEPALVLAAIARCGLNILQFHGQETPEFCVQFGIMTMKAFRIKDATSLEQLPHYRTDAWLLDSFVPGAAGGTGTQFNWELAREANLLGKPIFLAGGLTAENVADAIERVRPFGVDVSSGVESAPGRKDEAKMRAFVAAARSAD